MKIVLTLSAVAAALALAACGGGGGGGSAPSVQTVDRAVPVVINAVPPQ
jgi:ABC-type glycerol-3-phosphate transport system substrate-binding protein